MAGERIVGIDLGTTNSLVAFMDGGYARRHSGRRRLSASFLRWLRSMSAVNLLSAMRRGSI